MRVQPPHRDGCLGGVLGYPRASGKIIGQFREFESPRMHTRIEVSFVSSNPPECILRVSYKLVGAFSCAQIDLRKARERE